jgi:nicotinamide-nucleotide amidase
MPVRPASVAIISVGSEVTTGRVADTNAQWAAAELTRLGWTVVLDLAVDDTPADIRDALMLAMDRAGVVWMTGGLGPTRDDLTVESVAAALGLRLGEDPATIGRIEASWKARGGVPPPEAFRMARIPAGSVGLGNPVGTAPGIWLEAGDRVVIMMPGVPAEMKAIAVESVLPRLAAVVPPPRSRVYRVLGLHEGEVDRRVADLWAAAPPEVRFALQIDAGEVMLRLLAPAGWAGFDELDRAVRGRLGEAVWTTEEETLESHIIRRLKGAGLTVAVAESLTGGLVAARLTSVPGASAVVRGGWVAYANDAKSGWLDIDPALVRDAGAVSREVAVAMAVRARERAGADIAVSTTGWAGPDGGTDADPVGTVYLGAAWNGGDGAERRVFRGGRRQVREYAVTFALDLLRRRLP